MLWVWIFVDHGGQDIPISLLFFGFGLGSIYCFNEYIFTKGSYDEKGIIYKTPWTGTKQKEWSELEYIDFNDTLNWYVFTFKDGCKIRISTYMHGQKGLLEILENYEQNM